MAMKTAGFIVADDNLIHGTGTSAELAMLDALDTLDKARIALVADGEAPNTQLGSWMRAGDLKTHPATADLIALVGTAGGACGWFNVGDVACTRDELGYIE